MPDNPALGSETAEVVVVRTAVPMRSTWNYWDRGGDLGVAWRLPAYDDSGWTTGPGPLGYGESYLSTVVSYGPDSGNRTITTYFRADVTVADADQVTAMVGDLMYDDGLIVYLNGHEIGRPPPPPPPPAPSEDTPRGATWSYWDRGGDLGSAWRARDFDDSAWATGAGPLGYGEAYLATTVGYGGNAANKHITAYFRRHVTIHDPLDVVTLTAELMYDDGVVIYLNGTELRRLHMPAGAIGTFGRCPIYRVVSLGELDQFDAKLATRYPDAARIPLRTVTFANLIDSPAAFRSRVLVVRLGSNGMTNLDFAKRRFTFTVPIPIATGW